MNKPALLFATILCLGLSFAQDSANHHFLEVQLKKQVVLDLANGKEFSLPQFRIYDRHGKQVADFGEGYDDDFREQVEAIMKNPKATGSAMTLKEEIGRVADRKGNAVKEVPEAEFTFVEYWASWCEACHMEEKDLKELLANHKNVAVNVLHVEADLEKIFGQMEKKRQHSN